MKPIDSKDKTLPARMSEVFDQELKAPILLSDDETELVAGGIDWGALIRAVSPPLPSILSSL